ncbi:MAG TPA: flagellar motor protein [Bryobacteraceae bacterium]|jgi:chemotaxis protein MotA|nr:flagellar motor protein [Bryobacteraceae bacterium]
MAEITAPTPDSAKKQVGRRPDLATLGGLALALVGILGGLVLEQGKVRDVAQLTAAIIVLGGTLGAVMVTTPMALLRSAAGKFPAVLFETSHAPGAVIEQIIGYATKARKNGIVSLEEEAGTIEDPFLRKALNLAVDGTDLQELRRMMELEISLEEHRGEAEAKVYEAAGGYAPTIGIIGAVLGLIQVMKHLANIDEVGRGIAVAFVATVYGVASANILFLPAGSKLKSRVHAAVQMRELMLEGVLGIAEGLNPKLIRIKLETYAPPPAPKKLRQERRVPAAAASQPVAVAAGE